MRILLLTVIYLLITSNCQAQTKPSKIFTSDNKILEVYIKQSVFEGTPQFFEYTTTTDKSSGYIRIALEEIEKVELANGTVYEKQTLSIPLNEKSYVERSINDYGAREFKSAEFLVEKLVDAPLSLYQFVDKNLYSFFFYKVNNETALKWFPYISYTNEKGQFHEDLSYKTILYLLADESACNSADIRKLINNANYNLKSFLYIFQKINNCVGVGVNVENYIKNRKVILGLWLIGGVSRSAYTNNTYKGNYFVPVVGAALSIKPGKEVKNYVLTFEATNQQAKALSDTVRESLYMHAQKEMSIKAFTMNTVATFFWKGEKGFFFNTGLDMRFIYKNESRITYFDLLNNTKSFENLRHGNGMQMGLNAGIGYTVGKMSYNLRYSFLPGKKINGFNFLQLTGAFALK